MTIYGRKEQITVENSEGRWKDLFFFIKWSWFVGSQNELGRKVNDNIKRG